MTIARITLYNNKNDPRNEEIMARLHDRYLCDVGLVHKENYKYASVWCMKSDEENKMQELVAKYFNELLEEIYL
jgi:2-polyprenyl-6-methoxyphenol hydroxylase-like FAD-dependent oxidoreductase